MKLLEKIMRYIIGIDIGIASVGWSVVEIDENGNLVGLIDYGVRVFEKGEVPKTGKSLALERREVRGARRLVKRRASRLKKLKIFLRDKKILREENFLSNSLVLQPIDMTWLNLDSLNIVDQDNKNSNNLALGVWGWRVIALDKKVPPLQWAHILLHMVKHRGYLSKRKSEIQTDDKELGKLLKGLTENSRLLDASDQYRTPAELAVKFFAPQSKHLRNKQGQYSHTFNRLDVEKELHLLFEKQRAFGNQFASPEIESQVCDLLMYQKEAISGEQILKMLGPCTFEVNEYRAAKATYSFERFDWLQKLNNLRIIVDGEKRGLTQEEKETLIDEPYKKAKLTYKQLKKLLGLPDGVIFCGLKYDKDEESSEKTEGKTFVELKVYHTIRKALESSGLKTEWASLANNISLLDKIGSAFSLYKTDEDIKKVLDGQLSDQVIDVLLKELSFSKFGHLSLKALSEIIPLMESGMRYDEACVKRYGTFHGKTDSYKQQLLPVIPAESIKNPVVIRSLSQTRKVINAIILKFGSPAYIHIETGREIGKSFQDRKEIQKNQEKNQKDKERAIERFREIFPGYRGEIKGTDILKFRLHEAQHSKCLYTGKSIDIKRLIEPHYVEIEHVLPRSRTWDNSYNNKILVLKSANQNKGYKTPFEWFNGEDWRKYKTLVESSSFSRYKKSHLLTSKIDDEKFRAKNLNDTRYIAKFLCEFIENNLVLVGSGARRVFATNGQITAFLRNSWGLNKNREINNRHHALDAIVVACTTRSIQKKITDFVRYKELNPFSREMINRSTGEITRLSFPIPWQYFSQEVMIRVFSDNPLEELKEHIPDRVGIIEKWVKPLFVSRMPTRKVSGKGHNATLKSAKYLKKEGFITIKKKLADLKESDIENIVGYDSNREPRFYEALRERLDQFKNDSKAAFLEPFYKLDTEGKPTQLVRSVKLKEKFGSGIELPKIKATAQNATMVRIDIFLKDSKFYIVPVYSWQVAKKILPNKAVKARKPESEWLEMTDEYEFQFSLYQNDLIKVKTKTYSLFGYYNGFDISRNSICLLEHDLDVNKGNYTKKKGSWRISISTISKFHKCQIDILGGKNKKCKKENRQKF